MRLLAAKQQAHRIGVPVLHYGLWLLALLQSRCYFVGIPVNNVHDPALGIVGFPINRKRKTLMILELIQRIAFFQM